MSLKEDLARNRAVFEKLTGSLGASVEPDLPKWTPEDLFGDMAYDINENPSYDEPEPVRAFSLARSHGIERSTGMALNFEPPKDMAYPELQSAIPDSAPDALDSLYHQLDVEARQSSQLSCEGDF